jgi:hypothetical protein
VDPGCGRASCRWPKSLVLNRAAASQVYPPSDSRSAVTKFPNIVAAQNIATTLVHPKLGKSKRRRRRLVGPVRPTGARVAECPKSAPRPWRSTANGYNNVSSRPSRR